jgi:YVTN family beta-propeller protein
MTTNRNSIQRTWIPAQPFSNTVNALACLGFHGLATAAIITLGTGIAQGQTPSGLQATGVVYTADEHGHLISAVDLATGQVTITPVPISPHNVQIAAGAQLLVVGDPTADGQEHGHGAAHGADPAWGRLLVLDASDLASGPTADIALGTHPAHVVADRRGERAFVTNAGSDAVSVVDLGRNVVAGTIGTGRYPHGLRMSPDGREVYVANVQDGSLSVIDAESLTEAARIPVGNTPVQVGFTPDGSRVYVSLRDENRVAVVDTASRTVIGMIEVGRNPIQVHATPDGRFVYVANQGTDDEPADTVSVIEVATGNVVDTIRTGKGAHGVSVSDDGAFVFVTNIVDATVSVIDAATRKVVATFAVGRGPNGISYRPMQG